MYIPRIRCRQIGTPTPVVPVFRLALSKSRRFLTWSTSCLLSTVVDIRAGRSEREWLDDQGNMYDQLLQPIS